MGVLTLSEDVVKRFWAKVRKGPGCWIWIGAKRNDPKNPYCGFWWLGVYYYAHRFAWMLEHGCGVPDGMKVLHKCDRPDCVRPSHLFLGTLSDNTQDMIRKGRHFTPFRRAA